MNEKRVKQLIKKLLMILVLLISLFYLVSCAQKVSEPTPVTTTPTTEENAADIEGDVSDVGTLDEDLNLEDLENIDKELEDVTW